jgi:hypothetical protein
MSLAERGVNLLRVATTREHELVMIRGKSRIVPQQKYIPKALIYKGD